MTKLKIHHGSARPFYEIISACRVEKKSTNNKVEKNKENHE